MQKSHDINCSLLFIHDMARNLYNLYIIYQAERKVANVNKLII